MRCKTFESDVRLYKYKRAGAVEMEGRAPSPVGTQSRHAVTAYDPMQ